MSKIVKSDIDTIAQTYLRNKINAYFPSLYHKDSYPTNTNSALLTTFSTNPPDATPSTSGKLSSVITGREVRACALALGQYYRRIALGSYGLRGKDTIKTAYFAIDSSAPSKESHDIFVNIPLTNMRHITGKVITKQDVINYYQTAYNAIINNRDYVTIDLTTCHSSKPPCHSSRGRR